MKSARHKKVTIRMDYDVDKAIAKLADAQEPPISYNAMVNKMLLEQCKSIAQRDFPNAIHVSDVIGKKVSIAGYQAILITRVEGARNAARELRIIGECGMCYTFEDFMRVKADLTGPVRAMVSEDIEANGPHAFHSAGSAEAKQAQERYIELGWLERSTEPDFTFDKPSEGKDANGANGANDDAPDDANAQALKDLDSL